MPDFTVTVHGSDKQWALVVDAPDSTVALEQTWATVLAGRPADATGAYGSGTERVLWNPAHVTHVSTPAGR
jgi:hypothetical protein